MAFNDRLIILMDITKISSKSLAEQMLVDPSRISQLRTARRGMPKNPEVIEDMALIFAQRCDSESKRVALSEVIGRINLKYISDTDTLAEIICEWLRGEKLSYSDVSTAFDNMRKPVAQSTTSALSSSSYSSISSSIIVKDGIADNDSSTHNDSSKNIIATDIDTTVPIKAYNDSYFGNAGKREAYVHAFQIIDALKEPTTIYFNSDEAPDWYYEEDEFLTLMNTYINSFINKGFRIKQITRPSNMYNQMYDSIIFWLPMYLTGQVEPYYYPRLRDGVVKQSFLVVPGVVSVYNSSIGNKTESYVTILSTDSKYTMLSRDYFVDYLNVCEPAILAYREHDEIISCFRRFGSIDAPKISKCLSLSVASMPMSEIQDILDALSDESNHAKVEQIFDAMKKNTTVTNRDSVNIDICPLATAAEVRSGTVRMLFPGWSISPVRYYTPTAYAKHLRNIVHLLETHPNYHFIPIEYDPYDNQTIFTRKNREVILIKNEDPFMIFDVKQPDMITVFQEYLLRIADKVHYLGDGRLRIINQIKDLINELV